MNLKILSNICMTHLKIRIKLTNKNIADRCKITDLLNLEIATL